MSLRTLNCGNYGISLGLQIAQSRYYLQTLDPEVGTICILGALGYSLLWFNVGA